MKYYKSLGTTQSTCLGTWDNTLNGLNHNEMCILIHMVYMDVTKWIIFLNIKIQKHVLRVLSNILHSVHSEYTNFISL